MDPISALFATYLDLFARPSMEGMADLLGTEVQAVVVEHNGIGVPYSYQSWRITPQSVCASYRQNIAGFSNCTMAAQSVFKEACKHLQDNPEEHWKYIKLKHMYCHAAASYEPTIVSIDWADQQAPLEEARTECNLAVLKLMDEPTAANQRSKDASCSKYQALKVE